MQRPTYTAFIAGYSNINIKPKDIQEVLEELKVQNFTKVDIPTKKWKGYGFIEFKSPESLNRFIDLKQVFVKGREIQIKKHKSGQELRKEKKMTEKRRIFVQNIPNQWTDEDLMKAFTPEGEVEECYIVKKGEKPSGKSKIDKKVGYVLFNEVNDALRLIAMGELDVQGAVVFIKKSRTRNNERQPHSSSQAQSFKRNFMHPAGGFKINQRGHEGRSYSPSKPKPVQFHKKKTMGQRRGNAPVPPWYDLPRTFPSSEWPEDQYLKSSHRQPTFTVQEQDVHSRRPTGNIVNVLDFHGESVVLNRRDELFLHRIKPFESDYFIYRERNKYLKAIMEEHQFWKENLTLNKIVYCRSQIPNQNN